MHPDRIHCNKFSSLKSRFIVFTILLVLLAACSGSATPALDVASTETATVTLTATPTLATTATIARAISPAASAYLEAAMNIIQTNSLHRQSMDWDALRTTAFEMAQHAQTPADTYGAIRYALSVLGDHHSSFLTPDAAAQGQQTTVSDSPTPRGKLLLGKLGFIAIEGFGSVDIEEEAKYATIVQQVIRDLDAHDPCGWIVDLRENTGGNMWPMLAGLGPILGEGKVGAFVDSDGLTWDWSYNNGQALNGVAVGAQVNGPAYQVKVDSPPVAVLTGINTASSGEAVVVAFRGRPNTRSFGLDTAGLSTANSSFPLSDGALIILTTVVMADRTGQTYGDRIYPDEVVDDVRKFTFLMEEAIPQPAIDWLMTQQACTAQK